jgi:F-type H+-transporting ATPase subunit a
MVVTWVVALALIVFARAATTSMHQIPTGTQNVFEWLVESLYGLLESIMGRHLVDRTFWFFATVFLFTLAANWMGLIPGVGTIGWGHETPLGFTIDQPLLRGANADLNMTLAMALTFFVFWVVWAFQEVGPRGVFRELFAPKGEMTGLLRLLMAVVFFAAGLLEIVSILFRPVSLSFRLYGNIFAGEACWRRWRMVLARLAAAGSVLFPELLVGLIQHWSSCCSPRSSALICQHHEDEAPRRRAEPQERNAAMTGSLHIGLAAIGAAIGVALIGMSAEKPPSGAIRAPPRRSWSSRFWRSRSSRRSCSTRTSSWGNRLGAAANGHTVPAKGARNARVRASGGWRTQWAARGDRPDVWRRLASSPGAAHQFRHRVRRASAAGVQADSHAARGPAPADCAGARQRGKDQGGTRADPT